MRKTQLAVLLAALSATHSAFAQPAPSDLFISEYIEGSSNNKAIELYNPTDASIDLSGYVLEYYFNGNTTSGYRITLSGSVAPQATHVIANSQAVAEVTDKAQQIVGGSWYNGDDAIVLKNGDTIIDSFGQVGVDPGSYWESNGVRTADRTLRRMDAILVGDTVIDDAFLPDQQWLSFEVNTFDGLGGHLGSDPAPPPVPNLPIGLCEDPATLISAIQGEGDVSPMVGQQVVIEAIVTAQFLANDQLRGFFLQEEDHQQDGNPLTSEGLFVFHNADNVVVGDVVRLVGEVDEYFNATQIDTVVDLLICGNEQRVTAATIALPVTDLSEFEAVEGMLVSTDQLLTVTDNYGLGRYGEFVVATERQYIPTQIAAPGAPAQAVAAANQLSRLLIDDGRTGQNPAIVPYPAPELSAINSLRVGAQVNGITGVMTYGFSAYRVHPTQPLQFIDSNPRPSAPAAAQGNLRVASFNVLNYFNGDGQGGGFPTSRGADSAVELQRQQDKLMAALVAMEADVIGLIEMENDGFSETSALASLTAALSAESGAPWSYVDLQVDNVGTDAITSAIIYRSDRVTEAGSGAFTTMVPFDYGSRAPVAQTFTHTESGEDFTLVVAHLRSKGSCGSAGAGDIDSGDGQGCWNATRVQAVNVMLNWLAQQPTGVADEDVLIVGDMNAYSQEDPIQVFKAAGFNDLKAQFIGAENYSYVFGGESGSLDHAMASASLRSKVVQVQDWGVNADEPLILDYNVEFKSDLQQISLYAPDAFRSSDHDPVIVDVAFTVAVTPPPPVTPPTPPAPMPQPEPERPAASGQMGWLLLLSALGLITRRRMVMLK